jgi:hypothetical protein
LISPWWVGVHTKEIHRERVVVQTVTQQSPTAVVVVKEIERTQSSENPFATRDDPVEKSSSLTVVPVVIESVVPVVIESNFVPVFVFGIFNSMFLYG